MGNKLTIEEMREIANNMMENVYQRNMVAVNTILGGDVQKDMNGKPDQIILSMENGAHFVLEKRKTRRKGDMYG